MSAQRVEPDDLAEDRPDVIVRMVEAIEIDGKVLARLAPNGCWTWLRYIEPKGYGRTGRNKPAHRYVYEMVVGPIPTGLVLDHLCRNHSCVNPAHLEPVTNRENILRGESFSARLARQTHCKRGHSFDYVAPDGMRGCRTCRREAVYRYRARKAAA